MKNKIFKFLYKIFSFLADKTNGWKIFVSPKLFFGALVVGGITMSTNSCERNCYAPPPECYVAIEDSIPQNDTIPEIMCYDSAEMPENQN